MAREERGGRRLIAYVAGAAPPDSRTLRAELTRVLPDHMVPAQIVVLPALPRTPAGKVDRAALPAPLSSEGGQVAPRTPAERTLVEIWQAVLGLSEVGVTDNFFEIGGDSILSLQVVSRARQAGLGLTPKDLFEAQTIEVLARAARPLALAAIDQGPVAGEAPLIPIQAAFFAAPIPDRHHFNQALLLEVRRPLDLAHLEQALRLLLAHHDGLRLRFHQDEDGRWRQVHAAVSRDGDQAGDVLSVRQADGPQAVERICEEAQRSLRPRRGPPVPGGVHRPARRAGPPVARRPPPRRRRRLLAGAARGSADRPTPGSPAGNRPPCRRRPAPSPTWAGKLVEHAGSATLAQQAEVWERALAGAGATLPKDDPGGSRLERNAATCRRRLGPAATRALLKAAPAAYRTQVNDLLLTALARAVCRFAGSGSLLLALEGHGREDLFAGADLGPHGGLVHDASSRSA